MKGKIKREKERGRGRARERVVDCILENKGKWMCKENGRVGKWEKQYTVLENVWKIVKNIKAKMRIEKQRRENIQCEKTISMFVKKKRKVIIMKTLISF